MLTGPNRGYKLHFHFCYKKCLNSERVLVDLIIEKEETPVAESKVEKVTAPIAAPKAEKNVARPASPTPAPQAAASSPAQVKADPVSSKPFMAGLLSLKLIETRNLKLPENCGVTPGGQTGKDVGFLPFAVIEMDKNEVIMRSVEASPAANTVTFGTKANLYEFA